MRQDPTWQSDLDAAVQEAKRVDRLVLLHFSNSELPLSAEMLKDSFGKKEVRELARTQFIQVRLMLPGARQKFRELMGGRGGLGTCVLDGTGDVISVLPGFEEAKPLLRYLRTTLKGWSALKKARASGDTMALADAYEAMDHRRRAEELYRKALPGPNGAAHERLARMLALRGKNVEAMEHLGKARELGDGSLSGRIVVTEGLCCLIMLKPRDAAFIVTDEMTAEPAATDDRDGMLYVLGVANHDMGNSERALFWLTSLVEKFPTSRWRPAADARIEHIKNPPPGHEHPK